MKRKPVNRFALFSLELRTWYGAKVASVRWRLHRKTMKKQYLVEALEAYYAKRKPVTIAESVDHEEIQAMFTASARETAIQERNLRHELVTE